MGHQAALNRIEGAGLLVDGVGGPLTEVAVTGFQTRHGLVADGTAGEATERAFLLAEAAPRTIGGLEGRYFPPPGGKDAAPFSRASTVEAIVDGQEYFRQIKKQIDALKSGDAWYVTSWLHEPGFTFAGGGKVGALLVEKAALGVDVRVIVWANKQVLDNPKSGLFPPWVLGVCTNNVKAAEDLRSRKDPSGATPLNGRVLIDWSGNAASSHHMKLSVFSVEGRVTAFPSGLDYAQNRLDTPMHKPPSSLWHDAGNRVVGDAANAVLDTFVTRWTEASTLSAATYDIGTGKKPYNPPPLTPFSPPKPGASPAPSTDTSIQVVRSWPDSKEFGLIKNKKWATLPADGVHECKRTFQQMLGAAQRYVYIEDQGFDAVDSLFPKVVDACKRGVKVIALVPGQADPTEGGGKKPPVLSSEVVDGILKKLTKAEQMNLAVWILDGIFVHAKLVLVDDELMSIGSANFMDRSMQFTLKGDDSECTVVTVTTGSAVADLRVKLWAEHMRVSGAKPEAELRDLSKSLGFWRAAWGTGITFPVPDTPLVFVGPPTGGVGSGGGGSSGGGSSGGGSGGGSGGSGGTTTPITA
jgi:phosphatidylserine/phosphatidylglycerophosphate/cardiolipin synthase-like enzyme